MASPLRIYFVLAFALTWGVGGIALLIGLWMPESRPLATSSPLYYLAAYSVSLTGIVLTARYAGRGGLRRLGRRLLYSEDKVAPYTLPDPLLTSDNRRVTTTEMWLKQRRPEILKFFREEIYGAVPSNAPKVTWEVTETDDSARKGTAVPFQPARQVNAVVQEPRQ
jgi:hypothetical protein